ncbi:MAG: hypothetical protein IPK14_08375 [Blastocatellia bacterium]|nr:hypothetical protein [Blastocatellia bacterium]
MFNYKSNKLNKTKIFRFMLTVTIIISIMTLNAFMDGEKPFDKKGILNLVEKPPIFSDETLVERIKERKIDFEVTPAIENELITAGASAQVVSACRTNYIPKKNTPTPTPTPTPTTTIAGDEPLSKSEIIELLNKKVPSTKIEKAVEERGASFTLDASSTAELKRLGGTNALIGAIASHYEVVNNNPLSKDEILEMLRKKVALTKIEGLVEKQGVSFNLDPNATNQIKQAGGSNSLIGAIASRYIASSNPTPPSDSATKVDPIAQSTTAYNNFLDAAVTALRMKNFPLVVSEAQKAIAVNDKLPQAHYLLGFANLYLVGNVIEARKHFLNTIDRGGEVSFVVINDRKDVSDKAFMALEGSSGVLNRIKIPGMSRGSAPTPPTTSAAFTDSCKGSLFISKNRIKFQADDNKNSFDVPATLILEADTNKTYGKDKNTFHVKVKTSDDKKNYNFAMGSAFISSQIQKFTVDETNLAVSLISTEKSRSTR